LSFRRNRRSHFLDGVRASFIRWVNCDTAMLSSNVNAGGKESPATRKERVRPVCAGCFHSEAGCGEVIGKGLSIEQPHLMRLASAPVKLTAAPKRFDIPEQPLRGLVFRRIHEHGPIFPPKPPGQGGFSALYDIENENTPSRQNGGRAPKKSVDPLIGVGILRVVR
jgi:hypothetical protein